MAVAWQDFFFLVFEKSNFISSELGVIGVSTMIYTPLSMLIIGSGLSNINANLEESAMMVIDFKKMVLKILFPLIKPSLIASFVLVFIISISEFSVPAFLGVKLFTTEIFTQFSAFYNHSLAIFQSLLLTLLCIGLLFSEKKHLLDAPFFSVSEKGNRRINYDLGRWKWLIWIILIIWFLLSVLISISVLVWQSLIDGTDHLYQALELLKPTFIDSVLLAATGSLISVLVGFTVAYYQEVKKRKYFEWVLLFLFSIPSTIFGISLIKFYNQSIFDFIYGGYTIIIIAYVGKFTFISSKIIGNAIKQIPPSFGEAAQILGIPSHLSIKKILIPLILPALFGSFIINFIFCLGELGITIMVYPPGTDIMPIKVFTIMANAPLSLTSSMSLIVYIFTLLMIASFYFLVKTMVRKNNFMK